MKHVLDIQSVEAHSTSVNLLATSSGKQNIIAWKNSSILCYLTGIETLAAVVVVVVVFLM